MAGRSIVLKACRNVHTPISVVLRITGPVSIVEDFGAAILQAYARLGGLVRFGGEWEIQISDQLSVTERAAVGEHELVQYWRDRLDEPAIYASEDRADDPMEDYANLEAWHVTTPLRPVPHRPR
jgi:hypothetical protein